MPTLPHKIMKPSFFAPQNYEAFILCPAKFWSNADFAPQNHRDLVSGAKKLINFSFFLIIFVNQCYFRDLYNHWNKYLRKTMFCVTVPLKNINLSKSNTRRSETFRTKKGLSIQNYLKCRDFSKDDCDLLMAFRYHSVRGTKTNFSSIHKENMACPLKCDPSNPDDSQIHLMRCQSIISKLDGKYIKEIKDIKYCDIYSAIHSQKAAVRYLSSLL